MKKVQALSVFLSFLLISSITIAPAKASTLVAKDYYNPFATINEYIEKEKEARKSQAFRWKELPLHTEYQVRPQDTLQAIAQLYRIAKVELENSNPWAKEPLQAGQIVYIPLAAERVHHVTWGDTIFMIAARYGVSIADIMKKNPGIDLDALRINQELLMPRERKQLVQVAASPTKTQQFNNAMGWPAVGLITSNFGPRWGLFHLGIDIWNQSEYQTPIYASLPGTVVFADWSGSGYGRLVIVDHGNGIQTYYAHLSRIQVAENQKVRQGDILGRMGDTGDSIGVHLHFELRVDDQPVNPLLYLPENQQDRVLQ